MYWHPIHTLHDIIESDSSKPLMLYLASIPLLICVCITFFQGIYYFTAEKKSDLQNEHNIAFDKRMYSSVELFSELQSDSSKICIFDGIH